MEETAVTVSRFFSPKVYISIGHLLVRSGRQKKCEDGKCIYQNAGNQNVNYVEQRLSANNEVKCNVFIQGIVGTVVNHHRTVNQLPLTTACVGLAHNNSYTKLKFFTSVQKSNVMLVNRNSCQLLSSDIQL